MWQNPCGYKLMVSAVLVPSSGSVGIKEITSFLEQNSVRNFCNVSFILFPHNAFCVVQ